jgi:hypothetical protein
LRTIAHENAQKHRLFANYSSTDPQRILQRRPFWEISERQREWISRARLITRWCIFGRVDYLLWQPGKIIMVGSG